ncbi:MAG: hypothetical protein V7677_10395 [Motiliproteus sp.]
MNTIAEYSTTQAALSELRVRWANVPDTDTKAGYETVKAGIKEISGYRSKLETMRKELKAPLLVRGKLLDSEAKSITAELLAIEAPLKDAKLATDEREKREKEERIARLQVKVNELIDYPRRAQGATSAEIAVLIDRLGEIDTSHDYYDLTKEAMDAQATSLDSLAAMFQQQVATEAENQRMAEERERQEAEQVRLDAERQTMIAQQEAQRLQQEAMQQQLDAQRAEMERNQATLDEQKAEAEHLENARIEEERNAAEAEQARQQAERTELAASQVEFDHRAALAETTMNLGVEELPGSHDLAPTEFEAPAAPRFVVPAQRRERVLTVTPPQVFFVGRECKTILSTRADRSLLEPFFGDEVVHEMAYDESGTEYALELVVQRVRILNTQAA